jgi:hypothetical protein
MDGSRRGRKSLEKISNDGWNHEQTRNTDKGTKEKTMKKRIVFDTFITAVALAAAVCTAYSTLPEGRALSEQEKMTIRGIKFCVECVEGAGHGCNSQSSPVVGESCAKGEVSDPICDGHPGTGWRKSLNSTYPTLSFESCLSQHIVCRRQGDDWVWKKSGASPERDIVLCSWFLVCAQVDTTPNDPTCNPPSSGGE